MNTEKDKNTLHSDQNTIDSGKNTINTGQNTIDSDQNTIDTDDNSIEFKDNNAIEIRSEKVRSLLGDIPPALVRWGTVIILLVFLLLLSAICLMPYPYSNGETILQHFL